jgi:hypothetical protein
MIVTLEPEELNGCTELIVDDRAKPAGLANFTDLKGS